MKSASLSLAVLALAGLLLAQGIPFPGIKPPGGGGGGGTVAYDNAAAGGSNASPCSFSFTVGAGTNRAILIGVSWNTTVGQTAVAATYNGVSANLIAGTERTGGQSHTMLFGLAAPASGTNTVSVSWTGAGIAVCSAISATGVDQTTPFNNGTSFASGVSPASLTITSTNGDLTADIATDESGNAATPSASTQTLKWGPTRQNFNTASAGSIGPGTGTTTHQWTTVSGWSQSGANFKHQ